MNEATVLKNKIEKLIKKIWLFRHKSPETIRQFLNKNEKYNAPIIENIVSLTEVFYHYKNEISTEAIKTLEQRFRFLKIHSATIILKLIRAYINIKKGNISIADDILFSDYIISKLKKEEYKYLLPFYSFLKGLSFYKKQKPIKALKYFHLTFIIIYKNKKEADTTTYYYTLLFLIKIYRELKLYYKLPFLLSKIIKLAKKYRNTKLLLYSLLTLLNTPIIRLGKKQNTLKLAFKLISDNKEIIEASPTIKSLLNSWLNKILITTIVKEEPKSARKILLKFLPIIKISNSPETKGLFLYIYYKLFPEKYIYKEINKHYNKLYSQSKNKKVLSLQIIFNIIHSNNKQLVENLLQKYRKHYESYPTYYYIKPEDFYEYQMFNYQRLYVEYNYQIILPKAKYYRDLFNLKWTKAARHLEKEREKYKQILSELNNEINSIVHYSHILTNIKKIDGYNLFYKFFYIRELGGDFIEVVKRKKEYFILIGDVAGMGIGAASVIPLIKSRFITSVLANKNEEEILLEISKGIRALGLQRIVSGAILLHIAKNNINVLGAGMFPLLYKHKNAVVELNLSGCLLGSSESVENSLSKQNKLYSKHSLTLKPKEKLIIITAESADFLSRKEKIINIIKNNEDTEDIIEKLTPIIQNYVEQKRKEIIRLKRNLETGEVFHACDDISIFILEKL